MTIIYFCAFILKVPRQECKNIPKEECTQVRLSERAVKIIVNIKTRIEPHS
jgi:hypothetical protein